MKEALSPIPLLKGVARMWSLRNISRRGILQFSSTFSLFPLFLFLPFVSSCTKDPKNPFDNPDNLPPVDSTDIENIDPQSFVGLHQNIFKPTCANSGCHDGTFEPDFRTIESAYNTLVLHPIVKNNPSGTYEVRVRPGSLSESILWLRLNEDIDGISGIMPLDAFYDPESAWNQHKTEHLANISAWIMGGAKDMFGNEPGSNNQQPGIAGIYASSDAGPCIITDRIEVPSGAQLVQVWFAIYDNDTDLHSYTYSKAKMSGQIGFETDSLITTYDLWQNPTSGSFHPGFTGDPVEFKHRFNFNPSEFAQDSTYYMRVQLKSAVETDTTQIPQDGSQLYIKKYFSWRFIN